MNKTRIYCISASVIITAAMFMFGMPQTQAQNAAEPRHELSATFQGLGIGSMPFRSSIVSWDDQPGLSLGATIGYTYWFNDRFGIRSGIRLNRISFNQRITSLDMPFTASLPLSSLGLPGGSGLTTVHLRGTASSVQEQQDYTYLELPILLAMQFNRVFVNAGFSFAKAVQASSDYSYTDPTCTITELPDLGITPTSPVPMTLSGLTKGSVKSAEMPKPFYFLLDAEAGYKIPLGDYTDLAVGLYGRLAPIPFKNNNSVELYDIQIDATYSLDRPSTTTLMDRQGYYEIGVSLGLNFGLSERKKRYNESDNVMATPVNNCDCTETIENELAALKAARAKAEAELEAIKAARQLAEAERLAAEKAARDLNDANAKAANNVAPEPAAPVTNEVMKEKVGRIQINFDFNKTQPLFDDESYTNLRLLCNQMSKDPSIRVTVIGHTDNVGSDDKNQILGEKRAAVVKELMILYGAPGENIDIATRGESDPIETNSTDSGRASNRRVTLEMK